LVEEQQEASSSEEEKKKDFIEKFSEEREKWSSDVVNIGKRFREVEKLEEVQVDLYSKRQQAIEYQYKLISIHTKIKKALTVKWAKAYDDIAKNEDVRYSDKERMKIADNAVSEMKYRSEVVYSQIEFFRETIKGIDSMLFGVKHRIEIENFKIGVK